MWFSGTIFAMAKVSDIDVAVVEMWENRRPLSYSQQAKIDRQFNLHAETVYSFKLTGPKFMRTAKQLQRWSIDKWWMTRLQKLDRLEFVTIIVYYWVAFQNWSS